MKPPSLTLHLVSDSSGETITAIARACVVQFDDLAIEQHQWWLIRTPGQVSRMIEAIRANPGVVLYTVVDPAVRALMETAFRDLGVPHIPALDPVLNTLSAVLQVRAGDSPGRQHLMDADYFRRMEAIQYTIDHDDGQLLAHLAEADVILFGVSRTSKTPLCIYLANKGIKAANVPVVPGVAMAEAVLTLTGPLKIGLTHDPKSLSEIRRSRLRVMGQAEHSTSYADEDTIREEVLQARRLFTRHAFPVIDMTRRSIEEAAATVLQLYGNHRQNPSKPSPRGLAP